MSLKKYDYHGHIHTQINDLEIINLFYSGTGRKREAFYECRCRCGALKTVRARFVLKGTIKSCRECATEKNRTHGLSKHPLYKTWHQMMRRCYSSNDNGYKNYGGRGISVCEEWHDVSKFIEDVEKLGIIDDNLTLDRIDNNKDYCLDNCKASTMLEQSHNKRNNLKFTLNDGEVIVGIPNLSRRTGIKINTLRGRLNSNPNIDIKDLIKQPTQIVRKDIKTLTFEGITLNIYEWSDLLNIPVNTIKGRLNKGYSVDEVLYNGRLMK